MIKLNENEANKFNNMTIAEIEFFVNNYRENEDDYCFGLIIEDGQVTGMAISA